MPLSPCLDYGGFRESFQSMVPRLCAGMGQKFILCDKPVAQNSILEDMQRQDNILTNFREHAWISTCRNRPNARISRHMLKPDQEPILPP